MRSMARQALNIVATVLVLAINVLANALPIAGRTTAEVSDRFQVFFVPAGYVFAIWGLIYLGLIAFAVYQALPSQRDNRRLARIDYLYVASCAANGLWILFWHNLIFSVTVVLMLFLLVCLIMIYLRLGIGRVRPSTAERWLAQIPFGLYLGWITVATIANVTDLLAYWGWNGGPISLQAWAVVMIAAAAIIAGLMALTRRDIPFMVVIVWALVGIAVKQAATPTVSVAAWLSAAVVAMLAVVVALRQEASRPDIDGMVPG